jgi:hypothetical protein
MDGSDDRIDARLDAFFETQFLGMHEVPHRPVVDLETASGKLGDKPAQRKVFFLKPLPKPSLVLALIAFGLWPPILPAARLPVARKRLTRVCHVVGFGRADCR